MKIDFDIIVLLSLIPEVIAGSLVSLISGTILALFLPQKIAGPVFWIEEDLRMIRMGEVDRVIKIRKEDPLQDFAETFNKTFAVLTRENMENSDK